MKALASTPEEDIMFSFAIAGIGVAAGAAVTLLVVLLLHRRPAASAAAVRTDALAERIRAVGKLVGLEVHAKEIATSTRGVSWLPPLILSQAKLAMIFHFERQYYVDLSRLDRARVIEHAPGEFRVTLPPIEGALRLTDVVPYDIQAGRILGLIDVIQMTAAAQKDLMRAAQDEAAGLFERSESRYLDEARRSIERHVESLARLLGARVAVTWAESAPAPAPGPAPAAEPMELAPKFRRRLALAGA